MWAARVGDDPRVAGTDDRLAAGQGSGRIGIRANTTGNITRDGNARYRYRALSASCLTLLGLCGGRQEARTPDLRVANAALSQLS